MKIGILSLQGNFAAHAKTIAQLGHTPVFVKKAQHLEDVAGLIMPGGESTAHLRLLEGEGHELKTALPQLSQQGLPIFGTCAGLILLAHKTVPPQFCFGLVPAELHRNAYGSQKDSFITEIAMPHLGALPMPCVFIRAPKIGQLASEVEVLGTWQGSPILIKYRNILGATFHPEMSSDTRIHQLFVQMCEKYSIKR